MVKVRRLAHPVIRLVGIATETVQSRPPGTGWKKAAGLKVPWFWRPAGGPLCPVLRF